MNIIILDRKTMRSLPYVALLMLFFASLPSQAQTDHSYLIGQPAPNFQLRSLAGNTVSLSSYRGRPVLLNFWATWCLPCRQEIPFLQTVALLKKSSSLQVIGITFDDPKNKNVQRTLQRCHATYLNLFADTKVIQDYGVNVALPVSVLIDSGGIVRSVHFGMLTTKDIPASLLLLK